MDNHHGYTGLEFIEGFALLAGALWIIGALFVGGLVMIGGARADISGRDAQGQTEQEIPAG